jgi:long-chain fatty acid transport protein
MGYNLGVLLQPIKQLSFGATFRSTSTTTFEGNTTVQTPVRNSKHYTLPSNMSLTFPLSAVVGVSYRPTPNWNLEFDACYTEWSSFKSTTIYIDEKGTPLSSQGVGPRNPVNLGWQDSWIYELGVTRYLGKGWHASAGYAYDENSVPDTYYTPLAADLNRNFFSTGVGFDGKVFDFDLTYQFGYGPKHTVTGSSPSATPDEFSNKGPYANGTYGFISQAIMVSAGIHF